MLIPIAKNEVLAKRICSFFEINLDFYMFNDSVFHIGMKNQLPMFKIIDDEPEFFFQSNLFQILKEEVTHKLLTICTVYDELPNIQYLGRS